LKKALYGIKKYPRAGYSRLEKYLQQEGFKKGIVDNNIYNKTIGDNQLIVVVYVDEIIFGGNMNNKGIFISQTKYIKEMLNKFRMEYCAPINTPMVISCKLRKYDEFPETNQTLYMSMIDILLYLTTSRLNIMQAIGLVAWFQVAPKETHVCSMKKIFIYLKGTLDFSLWYSRGEDFTLTSYTNVDWADNVVDRKSTRGRAFFLGNNVVSWLNNK
jgi:hypothetical protein